jgi:hypothetical protein
VSSTVHRIGSAGRTDRCTLGEIVNVSRESSEDRPIAIVRIVRFDLRVHRGEISLAGPQLGVS